MATWDGLPDFGAPIAGGPGPIFAAYGGTTIARALPDRVVTATRRDGKPDFLVQVVRPALASAAPTGTIEMRLSLQCAIDACLAAVRAVAPGASVAPAQPAGGFVRLVAASDAILPPDLAATQYVDWANLEAGQLIVPNLTATSVAVVKNALLATTMLVWARLEIEVPGVAARLPTKVTFAPKALLAAILPATRRMPWDDFVAALAVGPQRLPIQLDGAPTIDPRRLGEVLADRVRMAWGKLVASPTGQVATIELAAATALPDSVSWDLATVSDARRPVVLELDPLLAPRALAAQGGIAELVVEHTTPAPPTGVWQIAVSANLPERPLGVVALGVVVRAPAHPPTRLFEVVKTIELDAANTGSAQIQIGATEVLAYTITPYVVLQVGASIRQLDGTPQPRTAAFLDLGPNDFPAAFVPVSASDSLLAAATIAGTLTYTDAQGTATTIPFALSPGAAATAIAMPLDGHGVWQVTATTLVGGQTIALGPLPAAPLTLAPWSFPGYGPHTIAIAATFPPGAADFAIDVLADDQAEGPTTIATILLSSETPTATWTYFATSPFRAGYRYRTFVSSGPPNAWSTSQPFDRPLQLAAAAPPAVDAPPASPSFDVLGVHLYVDPTTTPPTFLRYLPAAPIPARTPTGTPLMSLLALGGAGTLLQLSVRFDLDTGVADRVRAAISDRAIAALMLQPALVQVTQVTVSLVTKAGDPPTVIGTSTGSGVPPWDAIFSINLNAELAARAQLAFAGHAGILTVTLHASVDPTLAATLAGRPSSIERTADVATWVAAG